MPKLETEYNTEAKWLSANPLHVWRYAQSPKWSLDRCADEIVPSKTSLHYWENGIYVPSRENFQQLGVLMRCDWITLQAEWMRWFEARPISVETEDGSALAVA